MPLSSKLIMEIAMLRLSRGWYEGWVTRRTRHGFRRIMFSDSSVAADECQQRSKVFRLEQTLELTRC